MKLKTACELAFICGLTTVDEAVANVDHLATRIFKWENIDKELAELYKEAEGLYSTPISDHVDIKALEEEERLHEEEKEEVMKEIARLGG